MQHSLSRIVGFIVALTIRVLALAFEWHPLVRRRTELSNDGALPARSQLVQDQLAALGVTARVRRLPESARTAAEAAAALGCEVGAIASSLVFVTDEGPLLVMTSGRHRVDTQLLASNLGVGVLTMATPQQVRAVTGQAIGGVAPVGHPAPIPTVIDAALNGYATLWAAGGTPHTVVPLTLDELVTVTNGTVYVVAAE